jgi:hypothetical protein
MSFDSFISEEEKKRFAFNRNSHSYKLCYEYLSQTYPNINWIFGILSSYTEQIPNPPSTSYYLLISSNGSIARLSVLNNWNEHPKLLGGNYFNLHQDDFKRTIEANIIISKSDEILTENSSILQTLKMVSLTNRQFIHFVSLKDISTIINNYINEIAIYKDENNKLIKICTTKDEIIQNLLSSKSETEKLYQELEEEFLTKLR